jgi:dihydrofolate reductase
MFVIGGKEIYELFLPYSDGIILSKITKDYSCDTFMKPFDEEKYDIGFEKEYTDFKVIFYFVKTLNHEKFSQYESFLERIING